MRILHVSHRYAPEAIGGYEYNCQRFAEEWVRRGHEVAVLTRAIASADDARSELGGVHVLRALHDIAPGERLNPRRDRVYQIRIGMENRFNRKATRAILRSWRPDVIVFWGMQPWLIAPILAARDVGIPYGFDLGDYWLAEALRGYACANPAKHWYRSRLLLGGRFDAAMIETAVVHSQFMHSYYVEAGLAPEALTVIHRGIDAHFLDVGARRAPVAEPGRTRILCVGRLVPAKGGLLLVEAFAEMAHLVPGLELHFYGDADADYARQLAQACEQRGLLGHGVYLHGGVPADRMAEIYAAGDLLAFPVLWDEPSSNVLLEAMATGLPIVATRTGSNSEFVQHERTGLLVGRGDRDALRDALARLCGDDAARLGMGQAGRSWVLAAHRQRDIYDRTEAWVQAAAGAGAQSGSRREGLTSSGRSVATARRTGGS